MKKTLATIAVFLLIPAVAMAQFWYGSAGGAGGDMLKATYDPAGGAEQVAFQSELIADGTEGQVLYWDSDTGAWIPISGVIWDDVAENFSVTGTTGPQASFDYDSNYGVDITVDSNGELWITQSSLASAKNTFIGALCGTSQTGDTVYGLGRAAVQFNLGDYVACFGLHAGRYNTVDGLNAFGRLAGEYNTGLQSTVSGTWAGRYNNGPFSSLYGAFSGTQNDGFYLTSVGGQSGTYNAASASSCTFAGYFSGTFNLGPFSNSLGASTLTYNAGEAVSAFSNGSGQQNTGDYCVFFGNSTGRYNDSDLFGAFGWSAGSQFLPNAGGNKIFSFSDINPTTDRITVTAHGFGSIGDFVNILYTQGTAPVTGLVTATVYQTKIIDANTLGFYEPDGGGGANRGVNITAAGTGTNHTFTPQFTYDNTIVIGNDAVPKRADSIFLAGTMEHVYFGAGATGIDYDLIFDGETNDGKLTWMEDESTLMLDSTFDTESLNMSSVISPPTITGDLDDWNPTGLSECRVIEVITDGSNHDITGIAAIASRVIIIQNIGSGIGTANVILKHDDGGSADANKFLLPGGADVTLQRFKSVTLRYADSQSRWMVTSEQP